MNLEDAINKSHSYAIKHQHPEGYWRGSLQSNNSIEAQFIFLNYFLGIHNQNQNKKIINRILEGQRSDGTWGMYYESPGDLSTTVECYFALKLSGVDITLPNMKKAREFILSNGGAAKSRIVTKIFLSLFGQWSWDKMPPLRPEIILFPNWFPFNIYEFSCWSRVCMLPLSIIFSEKPICPIPENIQVKELFVELPNKNPFSISSLLDKCFRLYEKSPWKPGRKRAINAILVWMLERQQKDGTWGGIQFSLAYLIALKSLGYSVDHPVIQQWLEGYIKYYCFETDNSISAEASNSHTWDTAAMVNSLMESHLSIDNAAINKAIQFLIQNQIETTGDWIVKNPQGKPGGWPFKFADSYYPDMIATAEVLMALANYQNKLAKIDSIIQNAIQKGTDWLLSMQSKNGGWAFHDKDNTNQLLAKIASSDFGELIDSPTLNVTAHVLQTLAKLGYTAKHSQIQRALEFIYNEQEKEGSWFGHWYVNYIYGTSIVLIAFNALHQNMAHPALQRGVDWLLSKQNNDGGWGESFESYFFLETHGIGPSSATQTSWAVMGLMVAGLRQHPATIKGIQYLCDTAQSSGIWNDPYYTASAIGKHPQTTKEAFSKKNKPYPTGFMLRLDLYRHYYPLRALGMFKQLTSTSIKPYQLSL